MLYGWGKKIKEKKKVAALEQKLCKSLCGSFLFGETNVKSIVLAQNYYSENAAVGRDYLGTVMGSV